MVTFLFTVCVHFHLLAQPLLQATQKKHARGGRDWKLLRLEYLYYHIMLKESSTMLLNVRRKGVLMLCRLVTLRVTQQETRCRRAAELS